jgi:hypothetical protein
MDPKVIVLLVICFAAISVAGCMTHSSEPSGTTTLPASLPQTTPATTVSAGQVTGTSGVQTPVSQPPVTTTVSPGPAQECTSNEDCVPAECCHPSSCTAAVVKQACNLMCTASCQGPLDCGAGSCGCVKGKCSIVPSSLASFAHGGRTGITIKASPQRYSPIMSSTPGIGLEPFATGFGADNASFAWNATYGQFLSWNSPDFKVNQLGDSVSNHGEKLYWSFIDKPSSTTTPVTITITATDPASGRLLGSSTVTLAWEDNFSVIVMQDK